MPLGHRHILGVFVMCCLGFPLHQVLKEKKIGNADDVATLFESPESAAGMCVNSSRFVECLLCPRSAVLFNCLCCVIPAVLN
jgi:hypothetical protein